MLKIGIDFDDVLAPFVSICCDLCNEENGTAYMENDVTCWGFHGSKAIEEISLYYNRKEVYEAQEVFPQASAFIQSLLKKGEVYIITAVSGPFMSLRAEQIRLAFPEIPESHILMGAAKDLVHFDILLDDGPHNILKSCADYPVLMRKPWNRDLSGILAVNNYEEFLILVDQIKESAFEKSYSFERPCVIAFIGPSGSRKNDMTELLEINKVAKAVSSYKGGCPGYECAAKTIYGRNIYEYKKQDIENVLLRGENVSCVVDMTGALMLKRLYPTIFVFCKQSRESMFLNIMKKDISDEEKAIRCTSMEQKLRHEKLCDLTIRTDCEESIADGIFSILKMFKRHSE